MPITMNPNAVFGHDPIDVSLIISSEEIILLSDALSIYGQAINGGLLDDPGDEVQAIFVSIADKLDEAFYNILPPEDQAKFDAVESFDIEDAADNV